MTAKMIRYDDDYEQKINALVESSNGHIELVNDPNLETDVYFYERKVYLEKSLKSIENKTMKMSSFNTSIDTLIKELENA